MLPKLVNFGDYFLPTYGVLVAIAFVVALTVSARLARKSGLDAEKITNLGVYCVLAGLLGAKLLMIAFGWDYFFEDPSRLFEASTLMAAGVFQGGLALAILTAWLYARKQKLPWLKTADVFSPGIAIGHAIGRIGCFAAGCCFGTRCDLPWAVVFNRSDSQVHPDLLGVPIHPSQLYETLSEAALFGFLYWRFAKPHRPGQILGLYLVISSVARFGIEFTRFHEQQLVGGLSLTQWIAIPLAIAGVWLILRKAPASAST